MIAGRDRPTVLRRTLRRMPSTPTPTTAGARTRRRPSTTRRLAEAGVLAAALGAGALLVTGCGAGARDAGAPSATTTTVPGGTAAASPGGTSAPAPAGGASGSPAAAGGSADEAFRPLAAGDAAPAYAAAAVPVAGVPRADSLRVATGDAAGAPTLVALWATWCTTCREEFALLDSLQREYGPRGLRIVAVSVDRGPAARVQRFAASYKVRFPVAHDPDGRAEETFRAVGVPESYLIGKDGRVRLRHAGALDASVRAEVERALE